MSLKIIKKSVVLVVVLGIALIVSTLALAALSLMTQESRIAESKVKRARTFFAVQAGMTNAAERLRRANTITPTIYVGAGQAGYPSSGVRVDINRSCGTGISGTDTITINANY